MAFSKVGTIPIAAFLALSYLAESISLSTDLQRANNVIQPWYQTYQLPIKNPTRTQGIEVTLAPELLDIALTASVNGNMHARNRTSGETLWMLSPSPESDDPDLLATAMSPLIRTERVVNGPLVDAGGPKIAYAIELQSGVIYELSVSDNGTVSPSRRLVHSVPELAELMAFRTHDDDRVVTFVGKKKVRVLAIDLETGYLEDVIVANSSIELTERTGFNCWSRSPRGETEGNASASTIVLLERTDYELTIWTQNPLSKPKRTAQWIHFSTYGSLTGNSDMQAGYRRPADDVYIQSLPEGGTMTYKIPFLEDDSQYSPTIPLWAGSADTPSDSPVAAVFDLFDSSPRERPLALLQPAPSLRDLFSQFDFEPAARTTFFRRTEDDSLFAMSPEHFPLVAFHR